MHETMTSRIYNTSSGNNKVYCSFFHCCCCCCWCYLNCYIIGDYHDDDDADGVCVCVAWTTLCTKALWWIEWIAMHIYTMQHSYSFCFLFPEFCFITSFVCVRLLGWADSHRWQEEHTMFWLFIEGVQNIQHFHWNKHEIGSLRSVQQ